MPPQWKGAMADCELSENNDPHFTNWGEDCTYCNYWGPSLEKLELEDLTDLDGSV